MKGDKIKWNSNELELLNRYYYDTPKNKLLTLIKRHTFPAIKNKAYRLKIRRKKHCEPRVYSEEQRQRLSIALTGRKMPKCSEEHNRKVALAKMGDKNPMKRPEICKKMGETRKKHIQEGKITKIGTPFPKGEQHPCFNQWASRQPYGKQFSPNLKNNIRARDNHTCRQCNVSQSQLKYKLHIHHIDFDKKNNSPDNLISLCNICHAQTNYNRQNWIEYFSKKINGGI